MEDFIRQLMADQGLPEDLDPEVRQELFNSLLARATDMMNQRIIDAMSDEAAQRFSALLDEEPLDQARVQAFVHENVPDKDKVVARALLEFRQLYLGDKA